MRREPTTAELMEHEIETEAHDHVLQWSSEKDQRYSRETRDILADFAGWMLARRPPAGNALTRLAERLTPNPAMTPAGTLAVILEEIDNLDDQALARALGFVNARDVQRMAAAPITDEQWRDGDLQSKLRLIQAARNLKAALREMSKA